MSVIPVGMGSSGGYEIPYSLRFRASNSAYLSRTVSSSGNRKMWTLSLWLKRGGMAAGTIYTLIGTNYYPSAGGTATGINITDGQLGWSDYSTTYQYRRDPANLLRDPSAWYHLVFVFDSDNATAADRAIIYINGSRVTAFTASVDPALSYQTYWNAASSTAVSGGTVGDSVIGAVNLVGIGGIQRFHDGLLSEVNFIDGAAKQPTDFGEYNSDGVWVAKKYTGTYNTNGFYLDFKDGNLTSGSNAGLGKDVSGNGNYWNTTNISVTAGVNYDWMYDTCTNNYAVLNAIGKGGATLSSANLEIANAAASHLGERATFQIPASGKWYWEGSISTTTTASNVFTFGLAPANQVLDGSNSLSYWAYGAGTTAVYSLGSATGTGGAAMANTDILQIAVDADNSKAWFGRNNTWYSSTLGTNGDPVAGTNATFSSLPAGLFPVMVCFAETGRINFGQRPFTYTPPTNFKALCTANRPSGSITTSGSFTGNASTDGPFVWLNGNPSTMTINGNPVTFGTHADKTAGGFKVRSSSASYNASGSNTYSVSVTGKLFGDVAHSPNTAQGNP